MSERDHGDHYRSSYACVDSEPEYIDGEIANNNGGLLQFNKPICTQGIECPPYYPERPITCVVCTM